MPTTTDAGLRYPDLTSAPNIPLDIGNLASDLDTKVNITVATISARDALTKATGMRVYVTADKRIYVWDGTAFQYAGGAPPPIAAITLAAGWTNASGYAPGVYKDSNGLIHFEGGFTNNNAYAPNDNLICTLAAAYRPAHDIARLILLNLSPNTATITISASSGNVTINLGSWAGAGNIPVTTVHTLGELTPYHPAYTGTLPYS